MSFVPSGRVYGGLHSTVCSSILRFFECLTYPKFLFLRSSSSPRLEVSVVVRFRIRGLLKVPRFSLRARFECNSGRRGERGMRRRRGFLHPPSRPSGGRVRTPGTSKTDSGGKATPWEGPLWEGPLLPLP
eukprot:5726430-Pyramimonas_sp.AAC.2